MGEDEKGGNMSKIAGEINAEMMKTTVATQALTDRMVQEIESLRQQLADRDEQISDLTISSDTYFAERNSARDVWRRASKDRDELRQQLAEREKYVKFLRDAIHDGCLCIAQYGEQPPDCLLEALAATELITNTRRRNADDMGNPPANAAELLNARKPKP